VFIGWLNTGGITDRGYYYGLWAQAVWELSPTLTATLGARSDWQVIQDVYRQFGGDQVIHEQVGTAYPELRRQNRRSHDFTPRLALNWRPSLSHNLRFIYSEAFRAVPPQEIIRLPRDFGDAESELTRNWEAIYSFFSPKGWKLSVNAFRLKGNVIYTFDSAGIGFTRGSGWSNTGGSVDFRRTWESGWEAWANLTQYKLKRATDAYAFMRDYKTASNPPLPNQWLPLDSPESLAKLGSSSAFSTGTTLALEARYNGKITSLRPLDLNSGDPSPTQAGTPNYLLHSIPSSFTVDLHLRQDLKHFGWKGSHLAIGIHNLLDSKVWGVMNMDVQGWDKNTYSKPTQIPGFGRQWTLQLGYSY
jgi:outer membrane receptor protein involved in Fe transport